MFSFLYYAQMKSPTFPIDCAFCRVLIYFRDTVGGNGCVPKDAMINILDKFQWKMFIIAS